MNIYDFDDTIYNGDTCKDIVKYGLKKHFFLTSNCLIKAYFLKKKYKKGLIPFERVKEVMLSFIFKINNKEEFINSFVDSHIKNIKKWYFDRQEECDIIATASYEIWICVFAKRLNIKYVIGTITDEKGNIVGKNCKREEKVRRIKEVFPKIKVKSSYSDSKCDLPILKLAKTPYVVEGDNLIPYKEGYEFKNIN